jgi:hypothetical protein
VKIKRHVALVHADKDGEFYGACTCLMNSGTPHFSKVQRWKAEDWVREHMEMVERALSHLHSGGGSLRTERDHARRMLDDPTTPAADKPAWQILFDGADARLRDSGAPNPKEEGHGLW